MARKKRSKSKAVTLERPPVVAVMGHVDHGKTTLLDAIREFGASRKITSLTEKEHGGITQGVGAYQVVFNHQPITFLDTPGHEAFGQMRARGAQVADVAILVVAANDGVKPQTKEAIAHIKAAKIPFVVAINKIDLPEVSVDMVKGQLAEEEVLVEGYGGNVVAVPISAKQKKGIGQLLEMLLLVSQMQEFKADPKNKLEAYVIEVFLDSRRGVVANLVVKNGQLKVGDEIVAKVGDKKSHLPEISGKVKALTNEQGKPLERVSPGQPVQVLGFKEMPVAGAQVILGVPRGEAKVAQPVKDKPLPEKANEEAKDSTEVEAEEEPGKVYLVLKADTQGSLEAIKANLTEEVELVGEGVGDITESDILLAQSTGAKVIGFNVAYPGSVKKLAEMEAVKVANYQVIYHLLEEIQQQVLKLLEPTIDEKILGEAEVIAEFDIKGSHIAGCKVKDGKIHKSNRIRVKRGDKVVGEAKITAMQKERHEVVEVKKGDEVGLIFKPDLPFEIGDGIISYKVEE